MKLFFFMGLMIWFPLTAVALKPFVIGTHQLFHAGEYAALAIMIASIILSAFILTKIPKIRDYRPLQLAFLPVSLMFFGINADAAAWLVNLI